jgi:tRNA-splicing ligase RtcB
MPVAKVLTGEKQTVPVKIWTHNVDTQSEVQLRQTAGLPFVFKHVAAMPDVHYGKGATVGSVVATKGALVPAAVGVDIGCGMMAAMLPLKGQHLPDNLDDLFSSISKAVPVGQDQHKTPVNRTLFWKGLNGFDSLPVGVKKDRQEKMLAQMGTLGGGNHFIEVCLDTQDNVWVVLHSGSRGIGNVIGNYYIDRAKELMKTFMIKLENPDLAYLPEGHELFNAYWSDLQWAQSYAMENREIMMGLVLGEVSCFVGDDRLEPITMVNCHHNYAERENHFGENVIVTRKGAVRARVDDMGIIPGSMGTRSYIVQGLGNKDSFCSCSHGAGRALSRGKAKELYTADDVIKQTEGIVCRKDSGVVDEIPAAYKPIDQVMADQNDLVTVVAELRQILCVKG